MSSISRRGFLKGAISSASLVAMSASAPRFLLGASVRAAEAGGDNILVVIQLSGGNDGLNTVIPYADDVYRRGRPSLGITRERVRRIDDYVGLHPSMEGFSKLLEDHKLGIVQGVGYPNPNRSHFSSMDIWQSARPRSAGPGDGAIAGDAGHRATGWLGRYLDALPANADLPGLHLASNAQRVPLAMTGDRPRVTSISNLDNFKLDDGGDERIGRAVRGAIVLPRPADASDDLVAFLHHSAEAALRSSKQVQESLAGYKTDVAYPQTNLAGRLKTVAQLIDAGLATRVYYLDLDGFDTHSNQAGAHASLLAELSGGVSAFVRDLDRHGHAQRVMLMTFSEFGRRVHENASQGTDHGAAAPMFLAGGRVRAGLLSKHPSMTDLDEGDVKFTVDFRSVYAGALKQWLNVDPASALGGAIEPFKVCV